MTMLTRREINRDQTLSAKRRAAISGKLEVIILYNSDGDRVGFTHSNGDFTSYNDNGNSFARLIGHGFGVNARRIVARHARNERLGIPS